RAPVRAILVARKGEVYLAQYRGAGERMAREWEFPALTPERAAAELSAPVILLGDGIEACRAWLARLGHDMHIAPPAQRLPSAATVAQLGHAVLTAGGGVSAEAVMPPYLRPSEAALKARPR